MAETKQEKKQTETQLPEEDWAVKTEEIAKLFGLSERRVQILTKEGVLESVKLSKVRGRRYMYKETAQKYIQYLSAKVQQKAVSVNEKELKKRKLSAEVDLKESQKELHELKTDIAKGKYIQIEEVEHDYKRFFNTFKKFTDTIPSRIAMMIGRYIEPEQVRQIEKTMADEVDKMLKGFCVNAVTKEELENDSA